MTPLYKIGDKFKFKSKYDLGLIAEIRKCELDGRYMMRWTYGAVYDKVNFWPENDIRDLLRPFTQISLDETLFVV